MTVSSLVTVLALVGLLSIGAWSALTPRFSARRSAASDTHQLVPDVTLDDLERIIRRDFPAVPHEDVTGILNGYTSRWESGAIRVQLAALKLADGDLDALRKPIQAANQDYRDVLVSAEYPEYWKAISRVHKLSKEEHRRVVEADWKQYGSWLRR